VCVCVYVCVCVCARVCACACVYVIVCNTTLPASVCVCEHGNHSPPLNLALFALPHSESALSCACTHRSHDFCVYMGEIMGHDSFTWDMTRMGHDSFT